MIMVYGTPNGPQNDIGNYLGPCSNYITVLDTWYGVPHIDLKMILAPHIVLTALILLGISLKANQVGMFPNQFSMDGWVSFKRCHKRHQRA